MGRWHDAMLLRLLPGTINSGSLGYNTMKYAPYSAIKWTMFICIWMTSLSQLSGQVLVAEYRMDDCTANDFVGNNDGLYFGSNACICGVQSNGLQFDGNVNFIDFPTGLNATLAGDFTISFYGRFDNTGSTPVDIFSLSASCRLDSMLSIRFFPGVRQIRARISDSPQNFVDLTANMSDNTCWHYVTLTKSGAIATLYLDGVPMDQDASISPLSLQVDATLAVSNSPCLNVAINPDERVSGRIDEIRIYNGALSSRQVLANHYMPDEITSSDTTIFIGESVVLETGGTCSNNFNWSPSEGLSDPLSLSPVASPSQSTTYELTIDDQDCTVTDQVRVNVVEREELTCADIRLPSAFTPNNDGINEVFSISNIFLVDELVSLEVFNKWGGRVFFSNSTSVGWDGNYQGEPAPATSYVYRVSYTCQGDEYVDSGTLNLIR